MATKISTREEIIQVIREVAGEGKKVSRSALAKRGVNVYWIEKLIPEGLTKLKAQLGIPLDPREQPLTDDELFRRLDEVVSRHKRIPTWKIIRHDTKISDKVFLARFGKQGIIDIFRHYGAWLKKHKPTSKNLKLVDEYVEGHGEGVSPSTEYRRKGKSARKKYKKVSGRVYGDPLYFGNLIFEPTNEQGVVFLFGMVSRLLGFTVEYLGPDYPDCEAKRFIDGRRGGGQQLVRVEFEYRSRDFNHNPEECDLIVCWEDNWGKDCPLEVIELKMEIEKFRGLPEFQRK